MDSLIAAVVAVERGVATVIGVVNSLCVDLPFILKKLFMKPFQILIVNDSI